MALFKRATFSGCVRQHSPSASHFDLDLSLKARPSTSGTLKLKKVPSPQRTASLTYLSLHPAQNTLHILRIVLVFKSLCEQRYYSCGWIKMQFTVSLPVSLMWEQGAAILSLRLRLPTSPLSHIYTGFQPSSYTLQSQLPSSLQHRNINNGRVIFVCLMVKNNKFHYQIWRQLQNRYFA